MESILLGMAQRQNAIDPVESIVDDLPRLPCESLDAVRELEGLIAHSEDARKKLVSRCHYDHFIIIIIAS